MADVQVEHGFTRIADRLLEALCGSPLPARHLRVVLAVLRKTYGFGKKRDRIASTQLAAMTGISERHVRRVLGDLVRWGVVVREGRPGVTPQIGVAKDFERWAIPGAGEAERVGHPGGFGGPNPGQDVGRPPVGPGPHEAGPPSGRGPAPRRPGNPAPRRPAQETEETLQKQTPGADAPEPAGAGSREPPLGVVWKRGLEAAGCYRSPPPRWKLVDAYKRPLKALVREAPDRGVDVFAQVVHGYRAARDGWSGIEQHFTPKTLLRAGNRAEYLEAHDQALAAGRSPPFRQGRNGAATSAGNGDADRTQAMMQRQRVDHFDKLVAEGVDPEEARRRARLPKRHLHVAGNEP